MNLTSDDIQYMFLLCLMGILLVSLLMSLVLGIYFTSIKQKWRYLIIGVLAFIIISFFIEALDNYINTYEQTHELTKSDNRIPFDYTTLL